MKKFVSRSILVIILLVTTNVFADWGLSFSGTQCRAASTYTATINSSYIYTSSTATAYVSCPVAYEYTYDVGYISVNVYDGSTTESVSCTAYSRDDTGTVIDSITKSTSTSGTGNSQLVFYETGPGGPNNGLDTTGADSVVIYCYLPKSSRIYSYRAFALD